MIELAIRDSSVMGVSQQVVHSVNAERISNYDLG